MEIIIPLPESSLTNTYKELRGYLKQLELAIHHAQKAVENAETTGIEITEDSFVCFTHPSLESSLLLDSQKGGTSEELRSFCANYYDELQHIELRINLQS